MELVVLIGLQAAGKSGFFRERFAETHAHVSRDEFRGARNPSKRQAELLAKAFAQGRSAVLDNTNPSVESRSVPIRQAREAGARVIGFWFDVPLAACLERNRAREGKARIPDVALYVAAKRLERPSLEEGFDELWRVTPGSGRTFEVRPFSPAAS